MRPSGRRVPRKWHLAGSGCRLARPRYRRLHHRGHRSGVAYSLIFTYALLLRHPLVELLHREGLPSPLSLRVGSYLRRELGCEVRRLFPCQPLFECLKRGRYGLAGVLVGVEFGEVFDLGYKLLVVHAVLPLSRRGRRLQCTPPGPLLARRWFFARGRRGRGHLPPPLGPLLPRWWLLPRRPLPAGRESGVGRYFGPRSRRKISRRHAWLNLGSGRDSPRRGAELRRRFWDAEQLLRPL